MTSSQIGTADVSRCQFNLRNTREAIQIPQREADDSASVHF